MDPYQATADVLKALIPEEWVRTLAGHKPLLANTLGVFFGVLMDFLILDEFPSLVYSWISACSPALCWLIYWPVRDFPFKASWSQE